LAKLSPLRKLLRPSIKIIDDKRVEAEQDDAKEKTMETDKKRFNIRIRADRAAGMRQLVAKGVYPNLNSAFNAAIEVLLEPKQGVPSDAAYKKPHARNN